MEVTKWESVKVEEMDLSTILALLNEKMKALIAKVVFGSLVTVGLAINIFMEFGTQTEEEFVLLLIAASGYIFFYQPIQEMRTIMGIIAEEHINENRDFYCPECHHAEEDKERKYCDNHQIHKYLERREKQYEENVEEIQRDIIQEVELKRT